MSPPERITLSELNSRIHETLETAFKTPLWIVAEILEMQVNRSGHCYLELVEKFEKDDQILARNRATIWSSRYSMLRSYFETTTKTSLKPGLKLLVKASVNFHSVYGLSLNISDIDPSYTLGDIALKKQEILNRLIEAGVVDMNKELEIPFVPQYIAVISSETAAGLGDFLDSLLNNAYAFKFKVHIYPAIMQGEAAEKSIINALDRIHASNTAYDVVTILRGGGSQSDLECFNNYDLAFNIAQYPIPIITGIGHERDESIADVVANLSVKTPTAVAEFLLDRLLDFSNMLKNLEDQFIQSVRWIIDQEKMIVQQRSSDLNYLIRKILDDEFHSLEKRENRLNTNVKMILSEENNYLNSKSQRLTDIWKGLFKLQNERLIALENKANTLILNYLKGEKDRIIRHGKTLGILSPESILKRGYALAYHNGKVIRSVKDIATGDKITTKIKDGNIESRTIKISKD